MKTNLECNRILMVYESKNLQLRSIFGYTKINKLFKQFDYKI